jgi:hypothetical protein
MSVLDRILFLLSGLLAAYFVVKEIEGVSAMPMFSYTVAFGVLLVASLLLIIFGFEALDSPLVVILSTLVPLSLSLGLVWEHWIAYRIPYLLFVIAGFLVIAATRLGRRGISVDPGKPAVIILVAVHGVAGLIIFFLPILLSVSGQASPGFMLVGVGGGLIGIGGLLLSFLKIGVPILSREKILRVFSSLLLLATAAFTAGFAFT